MSLQVLIAEDDFFTRMELEMILSQAGHGIAGSASRIDEALRIAEASPVDAAIVDLGLFMGESGLTLARALREQFGVPSLLISGRIEASLQGQIDDLQPLGIVSKPFDKRLILELLRGAETEHHVFTI